MGPSPLLWASGTSTLQKQPVPGRRKGWEPFVGLWVFCARGPHGAADLRYKRPSGVKLWRTSDDHRIGRSWCLWALGPASRGRGSSLWRTPSAPGPVQGPVPSPPPAGVMDQAGEREVSWSVSGEQHPATNLSASPEPQLGAVLEDFLWVLQRMGHGGEGQGRQGPHPRTPVRPGTGCPHPRSPGRRALSLSPPLQTRDAILPGTGGDTEAPVARPRTHAIGPHA